MSAMLYCIFITLPPFLQYKQLLYNAILFIAPLLNLLPNHTYIISLERELKKKTTHFPSSFFLFRSVLSLSKPIIYFFFSFSISSFSSFFLKLWSQKYYRVDDDNNSIVNIFAVRYLHYRNIFEFPLHYLHISLYFRLH